MSLITGTLVPSNIPFFFSVFLFKFFFPESSHTLILSKRYLTYEHMIKRWWSIWCVNLAGICCPDIWPSILELSVRVVHLFLCFVGGGEHFSFKLVVLEGSRVPSAIRADFMQFIESLEKKG